MKIVVLNGSPKGDNSITIHSVKYLQKRYPEHDFNILHIGKRMKGIERNRKTFDGIIEEIGAADGVLWAFPVYLMMVPARLKRFIELIHEWGQEAAFSGKYAAAISTSIHFFDHTAHRYIQGVCGDLEMKFVASFSADMMDLIEESERERLTQFGEHFLSAIHHQYPTERRFRPLVRQDFAYLPGAGSRSIDVGNKNVLVVTDARPEEGNLKRMVDRFCASFASDIEVINLRDLKIVSSCIGCLQCGYANECAFDESDDFDSFYREKVLKADVLIFAGAMTDRYLSALWKTYFDRSFFMGHGPALIDKQLGFIISGPLSENENLREIFEGYAGWQHANIIGFVVDEIGTGGEIDVQLEELARKGIAYANSGYLQPATFLGVGGRKLLRDDVWGRLRTAFRASHRTFEELEWYDFPVWDFSTSVMAAVGSFGMNIPAVREYVQEMLKDGVSFIHRRIVEEAE
jgi:multimeric flavodoxin WrbA